MDGVAAFFAGQPRPLLWGLGSVLAALSLAALAGLALPRLLPGRDFSNLRQRTTSWWVMVALLAVCLLAGWLAMLALFMVISFIALREFLSLAPMRREDRLILLVAYLVIPVSYALAAAGRYGVYLVFTPVYAFLLMPFLMACAGQTRGYLATAATLHWGLITCVYNLGFAVFLMRTPASEAGPAGPAGLVFLLLMATAANDVAQYVFGKLLGRRKIMPKVSPNKTWAGFLGGWAACAVLIWFAGPVFSPLAGTGLAIVALLLPLSGFAGDVTMSAIKRDIGVKDTSALIPGHGGLLDRIDSLTFTTPLYFHLVAFFCLEAF